MKAVLGTDADCGFFEQLVKGMGDKAKMDTKNSISFN